MDPEHDIRPLFGCYEPVSCLSHLAGAVLFLILAIPLLLRARGSRERLGLLSVFVASAVVLLVASGLYHLLAEGPAREVLRRIDHAAIFVFIAGTYTAAHGILFRGFSRWGVLAFVWFMSVAGVVAKVFYLEAIPEWLGLVWYLLLGWFGVFSAFVVWRRYGSMFVTPLFLGAAFYTAGAVCEYLRSPVLVSGIIGPHEFFHFAVLGGIAAHWRFIASFAGGAPVPIGGRRRAGARPLVHSRDSAEGFSRS